MSAIPRPVPNHPIDSADSTSATHAAFLKLLPAVETHARIQFRHLSAAEREEALAETRAAAFLNLHQAHGNGKEHRVTPRSLARFAVGHVRSGRHVGGSADSKGDVLSPKAQRLRGFRVVGLPWDDGRVDCLRSSDHEVWRLNLLHDKRTPPPEQAAFRIDWSVFLAGQTDRTRRCMALLAAGHKRCEVADRMGTTPPAVTQRMARVEREWNRFQDIADDETKTSAGPESLSVVASSASC